MKIKINWDAFGVTTSVACAIHCAILPILMSSFPILGVNILENVYFEYSMILLAFLVGIYSLYHGYKKHHHRLLPLVVFSSGMCFLVAKQLWHQFHIMLLIPAVLAIITAHFLNYRFCRIHNHAHAEDCNH